jgi:hypothetical protein
LYNYQPIKTQISVIQSEKTEDIQQPYNPLLIQPEVIRMDTFAITTFNSSSDGENTDEESDNYFQTMKPSSK